MPAEKHWKTPISLTHLSLNKHDYPVHALPEIIRNAVMSYADYGQQPIALLANSALSSVSLACQGLANVARDSILVSPVSLYFITIASSGERKSAADKMFSRGIEEWEQQITQKQLPDYQLKANEHMTWSLRRKSLLMALRRKVIACDDADDHDEIYNQMMHQEPEIPLMPKLKYEDITVESLSENLVKEYPSISIWSDEAGIFLSSPGMQRDNTKFTSILNRLWDGKPIAVHRKTTDDLFIKDRRCTLNLMMQPLLLEQMIRKNDGINRNSGFFARALFAYPESTMGNRYYKEPVSNVDKDLEHFHERIQTCLNRTLPVDRQGFGHIPTLQFSHTAKSQWVRYFDYIESAIANEYHWNSIHDLASKASENIARLSALFHLFDHQPGTEIRANYVDSAYQIIEWHLNEAKRLFGDHTETQVEHDAQLILNWVREKELVEVSPRELLRSSPVRDKSRRDKALTLLEKTNHIQRSRSGRSHWIHFHPAIYK